MGAEGNIFESRQGGLGSSRLERLCSITQSKMTTPEASSSADTSRGRIWRFVCRVVRYYIDKVLQKRS
jgi:hypothetical protein